SVAGFSFCCNPQSNSVRQMGTVVDSRMGSVIFRNGALWAAHTVFLPTNDVLRRSLIQWFQIDPATGALLQTGRLDDPSAVNYYAFASMTVNKFNDVLLGYNEFSTNYYPSAAYSFRAFYDPPNRLREPRVYHTGEDVFFDGRWGDYSATCVDPLNDTDMWTIQEYAAISDHSVPI